jgi:hypothetical protein
VNTAKTAQALGYAGLIPFAVLALDPLTLEYFSPPLARLWLLGYGAVILSFLGGIVWGRNLSEPDAGIAMIVSILISLAGWGAFLLIGPEAFWLLAAGFVASLVYDMGSGLPDWFRRLRIHLSIGAIAAMVIGATT